MNNDILKSNLLSLVNNSRGINSCLTPAFYAFYRKIVMNSLSNVNYTSRGLSNNRVEVNTHSIDDMTTFVNFCDAFVDFIKKLKEKNYLNDGNYKIVLPELIDAASKSIGVCTGSTHGAYTGSHLEFNFNYLRNRSDDYIKHIIFHELVHVISRTPIESPRVNNQFIIEHNFIQFIWEIIAESTACDLLNDYQENRQEIFGNFTSDWVTYFNKHYQELGEEFLRTLFDISDERELFKEISKMAINKENISEIILSRYNDMDELHTVTSKIGNWLAAVQHNVESEKNLAYDDLAPAKRIINNQFLNRVLISKKANYKKITILNK